MGTTLPLIDSDREAALSIDVVYEATADFVWRTLQHLGVPASDLEDVFQEVFLVVHRKLDTYDRSCKLTTWLFGICMRAASRHRRRAFLRREVLTARLPEAAVEGRGPEQQAALQQRWQLFTQALNQLSLNKRATFVLYEFERKTCAEIAELMDVPVGTVHSRLNAARHQLQRKLLRHAVQAHPSGGRDD